ncbi:polysaccharide pyruvyl transferase family protein [Flavobacterium sp. P4023]|uniref:Polysaccharide pyruvyl transferase family protein n=1 Tax=Flavobacterium flabelliforme TaxID=2816119 RepID=A0ABS5CSB5_9FLAO|nr:polysaccharide pyruvyl transferase family protein [Flavobacterium flabelliforme]MBP4141511.1 polysaccharide pyruvyl transferase family protein [Flavobacterium flabelliforme]
MIKINVVGAYGETNFGDDLLMCVFENFFLKEFQNIELNFVGEPNQYANKLLVNSSYLKPHFLPDWEVYGGGTQFFAFQEMNTTSVFEKIIIAVNNPKILKNKIRSIFFKNQSNCSKIAFLGFGIGPFYDNQKAISNAKEKVAAANYVGVRDEVSKSYCDQWKVDANLGADVVFSSYFKLLNVNKKESTSTKRKLGIIVRDWDWEESGKKYIHNLIEFYESYSEVELQFIVFAPSKDKNWIKELKNKNTLIWDPEKYSIEIFLNKLNDFDGFISARYHGAIIGALLQKPVICIEIEPKLKILTEQVPEIKLWKKPFDINELVTLVQQLDYEVNYEISLVERKLKSDAMLLDFKRKFNQTR